jgi:hypothetical protein
MPRAYIPDPSLVSWAPGLEQLETFKFPFAAKFDDGVKHLIYVAGDHTTGLDSPNLKTVAAMFDELTPQAVLVEGFRTKHDFSYTSLDLASFAKENFKFASESMYALYLAGRKGIAARGGEPFDQDLLSEMLKINYSAQDVLGFLLVRMIPSWTLSGTIPDEQSFKAKAEKQLAHDRLVLGITLPFGYTELLDWYSKQDQNGPPIQKIESHNLRPDNGPEATRLQKMAFDVDQVREARFLSQLESVINRYDRILVVYGGSHLCRERKMFEQMLGKSKDVKPF